MIIDLVAHEWRNSRLGATAREVHAGLSAYTYMPDVTVSDVHQAMCVLAARALVARAARPLAAALHRMGIFA